MWQMALRLVTFDERRVGDRGLLWTCVSALATCITAAMILVVYITLVVPKNKRIEEIVESLSAEGLSPSQFDWLVSGVIGYADLLSHLVLAISVCTAVMGVWSSLFILQAHRAVRLAREGSGCSGH